MFAACDCVHIKLLKDFAREKSHFFCPFSTQSKWGRHYNNCICCTLLLHLQKQFLRLADRHAFSLTQTNTLTHTIAHNQCNTIGPLSNKHTLLCFQTKPCFCSFVMIPQKMSTKEREVLARMTVVIG